MRRPMAALLACLALPIVPALAATSPETPDNVAVTSEERSAFQQPVLALDPKDPAHLVTAYQEGIRRMTCHLAESRDSGRTWSNVILVGPGGRFPLPNNFPDCLDPKAAYAPDGTLHYLYEPRDHEGLLHRRVMIASRPAGGEFTTPTQVDPKGPGADHTDLFASLSVDQTGRVVVGFIRDCEPSVPQPTSTCLTNPLQSAVAVSTDGGKTFSPPVLTSTAATAMPSRQAAGTEPGGRVLDVFINSEKPANTLYGAQSGDGGKTFSAPARIAALNGCADTCKQLRYTQHAADNPFLEVIGGRSPGEAFLAYWDGVNDQARVFLSRTSNGGTTWSPPRVVGIPAGGASHQQHRPQMALSSDGRLYLTYYDLDPEGRENVYLIDSSDGGGTFSQPRLLTAVGSPRKVGPPGTATHADFGERPGLAAVPGRAFVAWTDTRRGTEVSAKQDVFFASPVTSAAPAGTSKPSATPTPTGPAGSHRLKVKLVLRVRPKRDRSLPYRYTVTGRVVLPKKSSKAALCGKGGKVSMRLRRGAKTLSARSKTLGKSCRVRIRIKLPASKMDKGRPATVKLSARFAGNSRLRSATAKRVRVKAG
jgi:hypothetical protein